MADEEITLEGLAEGLGVSLDDATQDDSDEQPFYLDGDEPDEPDPSSELEGSEEAQPEPTRPEIDWSHPVDVEGVGQIPLGELRNGYLRQADYTRKTQELAEQRKQVEVAEQFLASLDESPERTINALAQSYGITIGEARELAGQMEQNAQSQLAAIPPELNQFREEFQEFRDAYLQDRQEREIEREQRAIEDEISRLKQTYGNFDDVELIQTAIEKNTTDLDLAYDVMVGRKAKEQQTKQKTEQRKVAGTVEGRGSRAAPSDDSVDSIEDAWNLAKRRVGGRKR